jgi:mannose-6-phosphate isomerase-like protein (cupin superfamily)
MSFLEHQAKGLARFLTDADLPADRLRIHISEVGPGERSHPPHQHPGVEGFYMLEGEGTLEIADERCLIYAGEAIVFDPTKLHGLVNTGSVPMRYMVVIARDA